MTNAIMIDGKAFADRLVDNISVQVEKLRNSHSVTPALAVILVGGDPASQIYVRNKAMRTKTAGMESKEYRLPDTTTQKDLIALIEDLNHNDDIDGILVQLPLPKQIDETAIIEAISPAKDVDGFHPINAGKLATGQNALIPCTPHGCLLLLQNHVGDLSGKSALVIGRSNIVGKPMAQLLLQASATVTIAHSHTINLPALCLSADIIVAAVGKAEMIKGEWIKKGAVVIDVGINRIADPASKTGKDKLIGDVQFEAACVHAAAITPVPGGVGPMTIACLLKNTLIAACQRRQIPLTID